MKRKKMMKLKPTQKPINEVSEVRALLNIVKAIKVKESELKRKKKSEVIA